MATPGSTPGDRFGNLYPRPARVVESTYVADPTMLYPPTNWGANRPGFVGASSLRGLESLYVSGLPPAVLAGILSVTPLEDYLATQPVPYNNPYPRSKDYLLTNVGTASLDWSGTIDGGWVSIQDFDLDYPFGPPLFGTLAPGGSTTVTITPQTFSSPAGYYTSPLVFTNLTNGDGNYSPTVTVVNGQGVVLQSRNRGGTASLVGYAEYASPSLPAKKYLTKTFTGGIMYCQYNGGGACTNPANGAETHSYSGACTYSSAGVFSTTALFSKDTNYYPAGGGCHPGGTVTHPGWATCTIPDKYDPYDTGLSYVNLTGTTRGIIGLGICATVGGGFGYKATGTSTETLTNPDSDANALTRLLVSVWWSSYGVHGSDSLLSVYGSRTTGFTFDYFEVQWMCTVTAYLPNTAYNLTLGLYRSVSGAGVFTLQSNVVVSFTTDSLGNATIVDQNVPNAAGYDYKVSNPVVS
jgi:hypothetical protein